MKESAFWNTVREALKDRYLLHRIENEVASGTPDVAFLERATGAAGWIELKSIANYPARANTRVFGTEGLRPEQKAWLFQYWLEGGTCYVLARAEKDVFLVPGYYAREFNEMNRADLAVWKTTLKVIPSLARSRAGN